MTAFAKVKNTAQRGSHWLKTRLNGRRGSQASIRTISIGPPTNFRHEDLILGTDDDGNNLLIQQAREDARNMHKGSKMEKVKRHARKFSTKMGTAGDGKPFQGDLH